MKHLLSLLAIVFLWMAPTPQASAQESVSMDFFYDNLQPYGSWREIGSYGYCWQPRDVDADWRPFSDGRWVSTDAGWTWDSDEPFGWAVYHYGRWANVEDIGWIWIPGMEWGPGWVSWRHSPNYVGWAPLPPEAHWRRETGFRGWVDDYYDIGPSNYCFVEARDFGSRRMHSVLIDYRRNATIIRETTNITNIYYENRMVHNAGPRYADLEKVSRTPIGQYKLERRREFEGDPGSMRADYGRSRISDKSLSMFAPSFTEHGNRGPRNTGAKLEQAAVNHGWKHTGSAAETDTLRQELRSKIKPPDDLPSKPKFIKPNQEMPKNKDPRQRDNDPPAKARPSKDAPPNVRDRPPVTEEAMPKKTERPPTTESEHPKPKVNQDQSDPKRPRSNERPPEPEIRKAKVEPKPEPKEPRKEPEVRKPKAAEPRPEPKRSEPKPQAREPKQPTPQPKARPQGGNDKPDPSDEEKDKEKGKGKGKGKKSDVTLTN